MKCIPTSTEHLASRKKASRLWRYDLARPIGGPKKYSSGTDAGAPQHVAAVPVGVWTPIEIVLNPASSIVAVEAADGSATSTLPLLIKNEVNPFEVILGSAPGYPVGAFAANIDNVRMYW